MPKLIQFTVACEDRPGALARIARVLGMQKLTSSLSSPLRRVMPPWRVSWH